LKLLSLLSIFFVLTWGTLSGQALSQIVNRDFEKEPLSYILTVLDDRYDIDIRVNETLLPNGRYTYRFDKLPMQSVLSILLNDKGLHYQEYAKDKIIVVPLEMVDLDSIQTLVVTNLDTTASNIGLINLGQETSILPEGKLTILGNVVDARSYSPVASALILNVTTGEYLSTGESGAFTLKVDPGVYLIQVNSIGHDSYTTKVNVTNSDTWEVIIEPRAYLIDEIVISGANGQQKARETTIGLEQLSTTEIKQLGIFMGEADVVKSLLSLAGVSNSGDGASGFNVRGGSIDQNLITQDGAIIYNPSHVLGFFSTFNPDIIRNTSLNKGHIPAQYGGRVSSVLDINLKEANTETLKIKGGVGLISSKASAEIPIIKSKSALLLSGRLSYAKWILTQVGDPDVEKSNAEFNDFNAKYSHNFSDKTKANLSYFQSFDRFSFSDEFGYSWKNRIGQAEVRHLFSDHLSAYARGSFGSLSNTQFQPEGQLAFDLESGIDYNQANTGLLWSTGDQVIRAGVEYINNDVRSERLSPRDGSDIVPSTAAKQRGREFAFYLNDSYDVSDRFSIDMGLRYSLYQQRGPYEENVYNSTEDISDDQITGVNIYNNESVISYGGLEPRIAARYNITDKIAFKLSYNKARQYIQLLSNTVTPTPVDIWQVSTPFVKPLVSDNFSAGIAHSLSEWQYNLDIYYKKQANTIDYRDFASLLLKTNLETQILNGEGRSYGTEFTLEKKGEKLSGRMSYVYSRSERKTLPGQASLINQGDWYPSNFDQPHNFKLFLNLQISKRDRININFVYNTGRPITAPVGTYQVDGVVIANFSERNAFRLSDYHRLDLSYTLNINRRQSARFKSELTFSLYNFYARRNAFSIFFREEKGTVINALRLAVVGSVVPSLSYNFQF